MMKHFTKRQPTLFETSFFAFASLNQALNDVLWVGPVVRKCFQRTCLGLISLFVKRFDLNY